MSEKMFIQPENYEIETQKENNQEVLDDKKKVCYSSKVILFYSRLPVIGITAINLINKFPPEMQKNIIDNVSKNFSIRKIISILPESANFEYAKSREFINDVCRRILAQKEYTDLNQFIPKIKDNLQSDIAKEIIEKVSANKLIQRHQEIINKFDQKAKDYFVKKLFTELENDTEKNFKEKEIIDELKKINFTNLDFDSLRKLVNPMEKNKEYNSKNTKILDIYFSLLMQPQYFDKKYHEEMLEDLLTAGENEFGSIRKEAIKNTDKFIDINPQKIVESIYARQKHLRDVNRILLQLKNSSLFGKLSADETEKIINKGKIYGLSYDYDRDDLNSLTREIQEFKENNYYQEYLNFPEFHAIMKQRFLELLKQGKPRVAGRVLSNYLDKHSIMTESTELIDAAKLGMTKPFFVDYEVYSFYDKMFGDQSEMTQEITNLAKKALISELYDGQMDKVEKIKIEDADNDREFFSSPEVIDAAEQGLYKLLDGIYIDSALSLIDKFLNNDPEIVVKVARGSFTDKIAHGKIDQALKISNQFLTNYPSEIIDIAKREMVKKISVGNIYDSKMIVEKILADNEFVGEIKTGIKEALDKGKIEIISDAPQEWLEIAEPETHIASYKRDLGIISESIYRKYFSLKESKDNLAVEEYVKQIQKELRDLTIGSKPATQELRQSEHYQILLEYIYPPSNYSSVKKNIETCEDQLEHLKQYEFPKFSEESNNENGYKSILTGVSGYKIKDNQLVNEQLISDYSERMNKIKQYIEKNGPDKEKLTEAFAGMLEGEIDNDEFINDFFLKEETKSLDIYEKTTALIMGKIIQYYDTKNESQKTLLVETINDLILTFHYVTSANLLAYIEGTRDIVDRQKDDISKKHQLLSEINILYGETTKHVLNNELFSKINESKKFHDVIERFNNFLFERKLKLKEKDTDKQKNKFSDEIKKILANERIEDKITTVNKKILMMFSRNTSNNYREIVKDYLPNQVLSLEQYQQLYDKLEKQKIKMELDKEIGEIVADITKKDYLLTSQELAKFEPIVEMGIKGSRKSVKNREVKSYFSKTKEASNARMTAHVCIAGDPEMWKNENYFELVHFDIETNKCAGTTMLLKIEDGNKKYLWIGPNPSENLLAKVSGQQVYDEILKIIKEFAKKNDFSAIVVPSEDKIHGACTNRDNEFVNVIKRSIIKDNNGNSEKIVFEKPHKLSGNYEYQDCRIVWKA